MIRTGFRFSCFLLWTLLAGATVWGSGSVPASAHDGRWVALITEFTTGDHAQQYLEGARLEAGELGLRLEVMDARNNRERMARMIDDAVLRNAAGIMISHGAPEPLLPSIRRSLRRGVPVVAFDCEIPLPEVHKLDQDDRRIAELVLDQILADTGGKAELVLIWAPGFAPMEKRRQVYDLVLARTPGLREVARFGEVDRHTALTTELTMLSVLKSHPPGNIDLVWATYDEFAKGAARAISRAGRKEVRLYGVDVSNTALRMLQDPDNPWTVTVGVDPSAVGRVQVRMLVHAIHGRELPERYSLQPVLISKSMLPRDAPVTMADLHLLVPGWGDPGAFQSEWLEALKSGASARRAP